MVYKHIIDSLLILKVVYFKKNIKFLDIGTGAGFPSTPIAIVKKCDNIVQMDSIKKKVDFLYKVKDLLKISVVPINMRAENAAKNFLYREKFDIVTARAVAKLNILCEYAIPFLKTGGLFIVLKGPEYKLQLENSKKIIKLLGGRIKNIKLFIT